MTILTEIAARTQTRLSAQKKYRDFFSVRREAESLPRDRGENFCRALRSGQPSLICEIKAASPSKGAIVEPAEFSPLEIAREYVESGAEAISILTEPFYFRGSDDYLRAAAQEFSTPLLRKDFTLDEYQIYEAKNLGASAVLLIVALLDLPRLRDFIAVANALGVAALVEIHHEKECESAFAAEAEIIGINQRDLNTFAIDTALAERLAPRISREKIIVAESGVKTRADAQAAVKAGAHALLIGETLMRAGSRRDKIRELRGEFA